jgi:His Kinase A (phospho-acceptor) domain
MHRLLRTISHEIRNPLHGILGNSQALLELLREVEQQAAETLKSVTAVSAAMTAAAAAATAAATTTAAATGSTAGSACMLASDSPAVAVPVLQHSTNTGPHLQNSTVDTKSSSSSSSRSAIGNNNTTEPSAGADVNSNSNSGNSSNSDNSSSGSSRRSLDRRKLRVRCSKSAPALRLHPRSTELKHSASFNGTSTNSSTNSSSSSSSWGRGESHLSEALTSAKMAEAQCLVAEIHECALHQVRAVSSHKLQLFW